MYLSSCSVPLRLLYNVTYQSWTSRPNTTVQITRGCTPRNGYSASFCSPHTSPIYGILLVCFLLSPSSPFLLTMLPTTGFIITVPNSSPRRTFTKNPYIYALVTNWPSFCRTHTSRTIGSLPLYSTVWSTHFHASQSSFQLPHSSFFGSRYPISFPCYLPHNIFIIPLRFLHLHYDQLLHVPQRSMTLSQVLLQ